MKTMGRKGADMDKGVAQPSWVRNTDEVLKAIDEDAKKLESIAIPQWARKIERYSFDFYRKKYAGEVEAYKKAADSGYLIVEHIVNLPFVESAGQYLSRFFEVLKEDGKLLANRCPKCRRVVFPPRVVCGWCKIRIEDRDENWIELSDRGSVISCTLAEEREVDRATGKMIGDYYPCAFIRLDGGDRWTLLAHFLGEEDLDSLSPGMRVQAIWKPKERRRGRMTDIMYFRKIQDKEG
jgi:uncharacterized OB-fold protein